MGEQQLKDFGAHAETLVEIPDFAELDLRGRDLRMRRRAGVAAALALVVAVAGLAFAQAHRNTTDTRPIGPPHTQARTYHGGTMKDLAAGTYRLHPSLTESDLAVDLTLPPGWNSWVGPNRFDGHAPGRTNGEALGHLTWYVGALALEVDSVNTRGCGAPTNHLTTAGAVVGALGRAFSMEVVRGPEPVERYGYPATRMRLRVTQEFERCPADTAVFHSTGDGFIQYAYPDTLIDVWVLEVDGRPIYVQKAWTPNAPQWVRGELSSVIESITLSHAG